ncbi:MAG: phytoene desaturase family protein, partial [Candidatus Izemoplasmataceae bacterium]
KGPRVGGKMNQIKAKGYTFDLGPTIVMMHDIYKENLAYTNVNPEDYIEFKQLDPMYQVTFSDGETIHAHNDLPRLIEDLEKRSYKTASEYLDYLNHTYKKYLVAKEHFIERSFRKPSDFYNLKTLRQALKLKTFDSAHHTISKFVKDEKIQNMLSFQTLYIGISPKKGPSIYTIIPMIETLYGVSYAKGGMYSYAKALEKRFLELGGVIKTNETVEEILFENKTAYGIRSNGKIIKSDLVICNADFPWAMNHLVKDSKVKGKYTEKKISKMAYSCSVMILYIGLNKKVKELNVHNLYFGSDFDQNLKEIFTGHLPSDPAFYIYSPSQIDESVAPVGKENLYVLVPVPELKTSELSWDESVTNQYKEKIFDKLEKIKGLEDIRTQIDYLEIMTPNRFSDELNAMYGETFGLAPTLFQSNYYRPKNVYPYAKNLYFAGSSVHPGAGVPIAITSGKLVHQEVKKDFE